MDNVRVLIYKLRGVWGCCEVYGRENEKKGGEDIEIEICTLREATRGILAVHEVGAVAK